MFDDALRHLVVGLTGVGGPGCQAIDVAVVHAERGGDQDRVVDLDVSGTLVASGADVGLGHVAAAALDGCRDLQQGAEPWAYGRLARVPLDAVDDVVAAIELTSGEGRV